MFKRQMINDLQTALWHHLSRRIASFETSPKRIIQTRPQLLQSLQVHQGKNPIHAQ